MRESAVFIRSSSSALHTTVLAIPHVVADEPAGEGNNADNYASRRHLDLTSFPPRRELVMYVRLSPSTITDCPNHGRPVIKTRTASLLGTSSPPPDSHPPRPTPTIVNDDDDGHDPLPTTLTLMLTFPIVIRDHVTNTNQLSSPSWTCPRVRPAMTLDDTGRFLLRVSLSSLAREHHVSVISMLTLHPSCCYDIYSELGLDYAWTIYTLDS
ncbi:hypothetical protein BDN72DRAFT_864962 [Pluteus cervinus]|uniref:Uncharacterized protein n=1 Tax=Pluteus cervinus TaxID=181527 RepID=A0ACD3A308_9AGAR|nr:hypothetical protein BDN72DRAFT_864962 [Pluteus cervinus]